MAPERVQGAPFDVGDRVEVIAAIDKDCMDVSEHIGSVGRVVSLDYECGCGQSYPTDPMIRVKFRKRKNRKAWEEFWAEELQLRPRVLHGKFNRF